MEIRAGRGPDFAELAEALAIETRLIVGSHDLEGDDREFGVFYIPHYNNEGLSEEQRHLVFLAFLVRDDDGILRLRGQPEPQPGMWERIRERVDAAMKQLR